MMEFSMRLWISRGNRTLVPVYIVPLALNFRVTKGKQIVYTLMAERPQGLSYEELLEAMKLTNCVPLGIVGYSVEHERFEFFVFQDQDPAEVNALLATILLKAHFK